MDKFNTFDITMVAGKSTSRSFFAAIFMLKVFGLAHAEAYYMPYEPWDTLTPTATYRGGQSEFIGEFGVAVETQALINKDSDTIMAAQDTRSGEVVYILNDIENYSPNEEESRAVTISPITSGVIENQPTAFESIVTKTKTKKSKKGKATKTKASSGTIVLEPSTTKADDATKAMTPPPTPLQPQPQVNAPLPTSCKVPGTLALTLHDGVLRDSFGRIGSIVANRQFQFDGPPPQAGAIYAGGWSITPQGKLALGNSDNFYQCLSGDFYNLYDSVIGGQCQRVKLSLIRLVDC